MVIKVENLVKRYGDLLAVDHLNLEVKEGEVLGLLGPNGCGKSTSILCMLSLLNYDRGNIFIFGRKMSPDAYELKKEIGFVTQSIAVFKELTVYENIDYFCGLYIQNHAERKQLIEEVIEFCSLDAFRDSYPHRLSAGLVRRLNIACGIAHKPRLIFFDEPTVAVDPHSRNHILEGIQKLNQEGVTILYTSHYMEEIEQICTRVAIMDKGKIIVTGSTDELKAMIGMGEKINIQLFQIREEILEDVRKMHGVSFASFLGNTLVVKSEKGKNNLVNILHYLEGQEIPFGKIYSELPTLNDVYLEMTGKEF